jgi:CBS domain-containing protein
MKIEALMTRDVATCGSEDRLSDAARIMWEHDCGSVPVVADDGRVVAMITDRDVCMAAWTKGCTLHEIPVKEAMSSGVVSCHQADSIESAEELMRLYGVRRLPVVDSDGHLVGLLSLADIAGEARRETGRLWRDVESLGVALTLAGVSRPRCEPRHDGEATLLAEMSEMTLEPFRRIETLQVEVRSAE